MNRAIFLDRDGTLNYSVRKKNSFKVRPPYSFKELKIYNDINYLNYFSKFFHLIVITNQPDIRLGLQTKAFNKIINNEIKKKIKISQIFTCYCLKEEIRCDCYKPRPSMILKAKKKFNLNLAKSYMIGDSWRDIQLAKNTGCKSILVERSINLYLSKKKKIKPDFIIKNFFSLNKIIK